MRQHWQHSEKNCLTSREGSLFCRRNSDKCDLGEKNSVCQQNQGDVFLRFFWVKSLRCLLLDGSEAKPQNGPKNPW